MPDSGCRSTTGTDEASDGHCAILVCSRDKRPPGADDCAQRSVRLAAGFRGAPNTVPGFKCFEPEDVAPVTWASGSRDGA